MQSVQQEQKAETHNYMHLQTPTFDSKTKCRTAQPNAKATTTAST